MVQCWLFADMSLCPTTDLVADISNMVPLRKEDRTELLKEDLYQCQSKASGLTQQPSINQLLTTNSRAYSNTSADVFLHQLYEAKVYLVCHGARKGRGPLLSLKDGQPTRLTEHLNYRHVKWESLCMPTSGCALEWRTYGFVSDAVTCIHVHPCCRSLQDEILTSTK